ncbi:hypothetical protein J2X12_001676 [Pseudarthrobacter oxydans]|uniref:Uncharacterized protein n=1 Tax=Pseudarthrobacter oxydans TaxID=1671 RepID=A0AAW8N8V5_PSEOX|nr:hypothetical protein [Pseudarthrobacter oxydans]MDR7163662.1 hypothetical protein [Pseudarthrobacter oxydans]
MISHIVNELRVIHGNTPLPWPVEIRYGVSVGNFH